MTQTARWEIIFLFCIFLKNLNIFQMFRLLEKKNSDINFVGFCKNTFEIAFYENKALLLYQFGF